MYGTDGNVLYNSCIQNMPVLSRPLHDYGRNKLTDSALVESVVQNRAFGSTFLGKGFQKLNQYVARVVINGPTEWLVLWWNSTIGSFTEEQDSGMMAISCVEVIKPDVAGAVWGTGNTPFASLGSGLPLRRDLSSSNSLLTMKFTVGLACDSPELTRESR